MNFNQAFRGELLRTMRKEKGWSQSQLGQRIGAHVTSISDWERGDNAPSGRYVASLTRVFGVEAEHFFGEADDEEAAQVDDYDLAAALLAAVKDSVRAEFEALLAEKRAAKRGVPSRERP